ncbi:MAG: cytochrome c oxidase subunit 3 [Crocinitomicaceae bacterium]
MSNTDLSPEVNIKVKKNLLRLFIFAVIMIFAGLTSAYIVSQGGNFWVHIKMPAGFQWSSVLIVLSSLFLFVAVYAVKRSKQQLLKAALGVAVVCGILFGYFQFKAFSQLFESGNTLTGSIMVTNGRYGNYFTLTYAGKQISFKDGTYYWKGEPLSEDIHQKMRDFGKELERGGRSRKNQFDFNNYGEGFMLVYENHPVTYSNGKLFVDNQPFDAEKLRQAYEFGENLANDRGDFIMQGEYGEDFWIYYNGQKLEYENRQFYIKGKEISPKMENDIFGAGNTASSFIYVFAGMHLLHWIGGIIALLVVFIRSLKEAYTGDNYLGLTLGATYWHFLGILWLYLYGFLIFIH